MKKTLRRAVLDSACSQTVAGEIFSLTYSLIHKMTDKQLVETAKSNRTFCFEDGVTVKASKAVKISVNLAGVKGVKS